MLALPCGARFHVLSLGNMESANAAVMKKLKELAGQGAKITGAAPFRANGLRNQPAADSAIKKAAEGLWANPATGFSKEQLGKGKIFSNVPSYKILEALSVKPDFAYDDQGSNVLDYIHQRNGKLDFYFVRNTTDQWVSRVCAFRQAGKTPEIWDPVSGEIVPVSIYNDRDAQVSMPVSFAPFQSFIVVFKDKAPAFHYTALTDANGGLQRIRYTAAGIELLQPGTYELSSVTGNRKGAIKNETMLVGGPWKITFAKNRGAPDTASFPKLISWPESQIPGIKYYSGIATYEKTFRYVNSKVPGERIYLDLGDLSKVGEAWLNGRALGITWTMPFRFDVTGLLRSGDNTLRIEIGNVWANRIAGDAITGEKFTSTNLPGSATGVTWAQTPLVRSGLLGPVTIEKIQVLK